jgi:hypothetical protein
MTYLCSILFNSTKKIKIDRKKFTDIQNNINV